MPEEREIQFEMDCKASRLNHGQQTVSLGGGGGGRSGPGLGVRCGLSLLLVLVLAPTKRHLVDVPLLIPIFNRLKSTVTRGNFFLQGATQHGQHIKTSS